MLYTHINTQLRPEPDNSRSPSANGYGVALFLAANGAGYGSYTTLGTTGTSPSYGFVFNVTGVANSFWDNRACVTIAYGAAGSEKIMVSDLLVSERGGATQFNAPVYLPLYIPPSTRVAVKMAWSGASSSYAPTPYADITFLQDDPIAGSEFSRFQKCDTYGVVSTTTLIRGTEVSSGSPAGTYGTQVSLGTTTRDYGAVLLSVGSLGGSGGSTVGNRLIRLRAGSSGGIIANYVCIAASSYVFSGPYPGTPVVCSISSGTQLYASTASGSGGITITDWAAYCFY